MQATNFLITRQIFPRAKFIQAVPAVKALIAGIILPKKGVKVGNRGEMSTDREQVDELFSQPSIEA